MSSHSLAKRTSAPARIRTSAPRRRTVLAQTRRRLAIQAYETPLPSAGAILARPIRRGGRRPIAYLDPDERVRELRTMDRLLTADEVAERLGMRTDWVWAQARAGRIPHVRLGRYRRFRESALDAWIASLEASSTKPQAARPVPLRRSA